MVVSSHPMSRSAFDKLNGALQRCDRTGVSRNVEVIRHQHERMKGESALISVMEQPSTKSTQFCSAKRGDDSPMFAT